MGDRRRGDKKTLKDIDRDRERETERERERDREREGPFH